MTDRQPVAILGAGPTGLEAALAAAEHGWPFTLYEAGDRVASAVRSWGHVRLFSPWSLNVSPRARARLSAAGHELPAADSAACPTGHELCDRVFEPLAALDEIAPHLRLGSRVVAVGREGLLKHEEIGTGARREHSFRLLVADGSGGPWGRERIERAAVVIDCTGTWERPNALGDGGIPAPGEAALDDARLVRRIPDFAAERKDWAGRIVLLVGAGHSAQTAASELASLAESAPGTRVLWALRAEEPAWHVDPDDPLPERSRLTARARDLAGGGSPAVEAIAGVVVERLDPNRDSGRVRVSLRRRDGTRRDVEVDRILSLTGSVGDHLIYRQLQVHECYATSGPMKLAAALLSATGGSAGGDCLAQESLGADTLVNPEPGFFLLGSKSYGRNTTFLMRVGWQQVDEIFGLLEAARAA